MKLKIIDYIKSQERKGYPNGLPDEAPLYLEQLGKVPSYKRIAIAIMKNDASLKSLGYTPKKSQYYNLLKKIELSSRPTTHPKYKKINLTIQLTLF